MTGRGMEESKDQEKEINNEVNRENGGCGKINLPLFFCLTPPLYNAQHSPKSCLGGWFCWNNDMMVFMKARILDDGIYEG